MTVQWTLVNEVSMSTIVWSIAMNGTDQKDDLSLLLLPSQRNVYTTVAIVMIILDVMAIAGNVLVLFVIFKQRSLNRPMHYFILNLAASDLSVAILGYPMTIASAINREWLFGQIGCQVYAFLCYTFSLNSLLTHVVISHYRYLSMQNYKQGKLDDRHVLRSLIFCWTYSLFWTISPLLGWSSYSLEPWPISCSINWHSRKLGDIIYVIGVTVFVLVLPLIVLMLYYFKISAKSSRMNSETSVPGSQLRANIQKRVTMICFLMTILFLITWMPYAVVSISVAFGLDLTGSTITLLPTMFTKAACSYNPLIYCLTNSNFRQTIGNFLCKRSLRRVDTYSTTALDPQTTDEVAFTDRYGKYTMFNCFTISSLQHMETSFIEKEDINNHTLNVLKPRPATHDLNVLKPRPATHDLNVLKPRPATHEVRNKTEFDKICQM